MSPREEEVHEDPRILIRPGTSVRLIRAFEGPRHERLYKLWDCIAEYYRRRLILRWFANPGAKLNHADCYARMWNEELEFDNRFTLFTEADFLPNLHNDAWIGAPLRDTVSMAGVMYATRETSSARMIQYSNVQGAWWLFLDKWTAPRELKFKGDPDPCNQLYGLFPEDSFYLYNGIDCLDLEPPHYGLAYPWGEHLFWSRHLHDDPHVRVSGFNLGVIQRLHDTAVARWFKSTPAKFQEIVRHRAPALYSELWSGFTGDPSTFDLSSVKSSPLLETAPRRSA